jgi:hypothetical protein
MIGLLRLLLVTFHQVKVRALKLASKHTLVTYPFSRLSRFTSARMERHVLQTN